MIKKKKSWLLINHTTQQSNVNIRPRMGGAVVELTSPSQRVARRSFFFSSRRRHTRCSRDWSSDVCSSDLDTDPSRIARPSSSKYVPVVEYDASGLMPGK